MRRKTSGKLIIALFIFVLLSVNINMIGIPVAQEIHNIAVVSFTPYPTKVGLETGELVDLTVVIENQGTENEDFNVTVSYGNETTQTTIIDTQNVTNQAANTNKTLTFTWNTTNVTVGTYFFNATASFVSNETNTADNTLISTVEVNTVDVVSPYVTILPRHTMDTTLTPGKTYNVSIYTDYNGSDIWGYELVLTYNPTVLEGVEVVNGGLITEGDVTFVAGTFNNTEGKLSLTTANSLNMSAPLPYPPLNNTGPGILANVTFTVIREGDSHINIVRGSFGASSELKRVDSSAIVSYSTDLDPDPTQGKFLDGFFQNVEEAIHDVALISFDFSPNNVTAGEPVNINVTIKNEGTVTEDASVTVYWGFAGGQPLHPISDPETVTIESGENETLAFTWDTTEVSGGTHPLTAVVTLVGGVEDVNPENNIWKIDDAIIVEIFQGTPFPIELVIIVVVVIVALVVIYIVIRRIRK